MTIEIHVNEYCHWNKGERYRDLVEWGIFRLAIWKWLVVLFAKTSIASWHVDEVKSACLTKGQWIDCHNSPNYSKTIFVSGHNFLLLADNTDWLKSCTWHLSFVICHLSFVICPLRWITKIFDFDFEIHFDMKINMNMNMNMNMNKGTNKIIRINI
jgi:hypothetical protein